MLELYRKTYVDINLDHLKHNCRRLMSLLRENEFFCPMVKSNAYGHGDFEVVKALLEEGVQQVGVALIEEGVRLRRYGLTDLMIYVFGSFDALGAQAIVAHNLTPVLSDWSQIKALEQALASTAAFPVHVKFNTGMNRLGFSCEESQRLASYFETSRQMRLAGLCTHLSCGEDAGMPGGRTLKQLHRLEEISQQFPDNLVHHSLNSAGMLALKLAKPLLSKTYGCRPGLSLYGIEPELEGMTDALQKSMQQLQLKPVMQLYSEVIQYHLVPVGEKVSYGGHWTAKEPSVIGVVPIGYADGFSRAFSNNGSMLFRGQRVEVVGTVCMDYTMIDLTPVLKGSVGEIGEAVIVFGEQLEQELSVGEQAKRIGTLPYELMTSIGRRVPRKYTV